MTVINTLLFAAAAFLGSVLVIGAALLLARGRTAASRHLIVTGAFAALLGLPLAALLLPSQWVWMLPAAVSAAAPVGAPATMAPAPGFGVAQALAVIAAVWALGVMFHLLKLTLGGIGLIRLYRRSVAHSPHGIDDAPFRGLGWQLRLHTSPGGCGPLTWGVVKPVVLLPKASVAWPRERLLSVLLHEAAHVRRKDCLCRLIAILTAALYWPNPLVWVAARRQRADAERAADNAVLAAGIKPTRYAEHLVGLAREFSSASFALSLSMAEQRLLDTRVTSILDPDQSRSGVTTMDVLKLGVAAVALMAGLAMVRPSLAETPDTPPVAVPPSPPAAGVAPKHTVHRILRISRHGRVTQYTADEDVTPPPPPPADLAAPPAPVEPPVPPAPPRLDEAQQAVHGQAEARRAMAEARRALAQVNLDQTVRQALQQAATAMRNANVSEADAKRALAQVDVDRVVAEAMKNAQSALQRAQAHRRRVVRSQSDGNNAAETDD